MTDFDLVVIGGGNAGLTAAQIAAEAGKKVALIDRGAVGGLCSLAGCNPKKVLVRATEVLQEVRDAGEHGITATPSIEWRKVWQRKHRFTDPVPESTEKWLADSGIELIRGSARFASPEMMSIDSSRLRASAFVIATGSHPRPLTFPGAEHLRISDDVLELQEAPPRMLIVGAGVVAFEFGHVFARLGTKVTMAMRTTRALAGFDDDFVAPFIEYSRGLGIEFLTNTEIERVDRSGTGYRVRIKTPNGVLTRDADFVLNAAGRIPSIESLDLGAGQVAVGRKGVTVDDYLRSTTNRRVFAGGDAHGRMLHSPVASYEGRLIARNFLEGDVERADHSAIPHAVYTVPQLAAVGLTEAEAREKNRDFVVKRNDMTNWRVFAIAGSHLAHAKVLIENGSQRILGAQLLGEAAAENINLFSLAMRANQTANALREMVFAYPTFASVIPSVL